MRKITLALSAVCLLLGFNQSVVARESVPAPLNPGVTVAQLAQQVPIRWVSVAQIKIVCWVAHRWRLVLISTTLYYSQALVFIAGKKSTRQKNPEFREKINNGWDEFSMPKEVAKSLIAMHLKRGDSIYFVTGRSQTKTETVLKRCKTIS